MTNTSSKSRPAPRLIEIDPSHAGQRIDNFLLGHLKGVPRSYVYRVLRTGEVRVNKSRVKPTYRLEEGDSVRIPPVVEKEGASSAGLSISPQLIQRLESSILYEDDGLLVLNKPSGVPVHGGSGLAYGVIEILRTSRPEAGFLELVHRLDRDTSGCLMIAKSREVLGALHDMLREGGMEKTYLALVKGRWSGGERTVSAPLLKNVLESGERRVHVTREGKDSDTVFAPVEFYPQATLMTANPLTGRTHQIRVHAAHMKHPIAGDDKYGDEIFNKTLRKFGLKRLFLHASTLSFKLPGDKKKKTFKAPLDQGLQQVLDRLAGKDE